MLHILLEKIKELIKRYKEKIFEIPEIKFIKDNFHQIALNNNNNAYTGDDDSESENLPTYFNEPIKSVIKTLLEELKNIKNSLIESSKDIEFIFKLPINYLSNNEHSEEKNIHTDNNSFNLQEIHREEFTNTLINDEFISQLLAQIHQMKSYKIMAEIVKLTNQIEEYRYDSNISEQGRISNIISLEIKRILEEEKEQQKNIEQAREIIRTNNLLKQQKEKELQELKRLKELKQIKELKQLNLNQGKTDSVEEKTQLNLISKHENLDELVEYIKSDDNKPKKTKKKNNRKKNKKSNLNNNENSDNCFDEEVEKFKEFIINSYSNIQNIKKIKPLISQKWIEDIKNLVN
jgi:hypothetical protein